MSTKCVVNFSHEVIMSKVYIHSDGYPDGEHGIPARLETFFDDVKAQTSDTRFNDPSYLAAKFVVWIANNDARKGYHLDFTGVGVVIKDPEDIEYSYFVDCSVAGRPEVTFIEV